MESECKRLNLENVVLDLFSHFTLGKVQWLLVSLRLLRFVPIVCIFAQLTIRCLPPCAARARHRPHILRGSFFRVYSYHGSLRRLTPATGRVRLTLLENANSCSCASSTCAIASKSHMITYGTWTRQLCGWFQQARAGGPEKPSQPSLRLARFRHGHARCKHEAHGPLFPRQLVSHPPTQWITQDAPLDMIDAIDTDMHAHPGDAELIPWLLVLDCASQHVAKEFRSIMRDTRPHIKPCYVQRNFTAYIQQLD